MSNEPQVVGHTFEDPTEALEHFTPERMAAARPRVIALDEDGRRIDAAPEDRPEPGDES